MMKKYLSLLLAVVLSTLCLTGCGINQEAVDNVTGLITSSFTAPDRILMVNKPLYELSVDYDEPKLREGDPEKYNVRFDELYAPYCNENLLDSLKSAGRSAQFSCEMSGKICSVDNIIVEEGENDFYYFTATVHYGLKDDSEESYEISGKVQVDENNKASYCVLDTKEIYELLQ